MTPQPITPELLESMSNPIMLNFRPGDPLDIEAFIKAGQANPNRVYRWARHLIPVLIELFMTHDHFSNTRPIREVFEHVKNAKGNSILVKWLDPEYGGRLIEFIPFTELTPLMLDPWKYVPQDFSCTGTKCARNLIYHNMALLASWDKKRISELCKEHAKNHACKDNNCLFQGFI